MKLISNNYKRARDKGIHDYLDGKKLSDNPYRHFSDVSYASWWDAGFCQEHNKAIIEERGGVD